MASAVNGLTGSSSTDNSNQSSGALGIQAPSEEMFLKLLVAQLQNQDPLNPTDSTQFVSQLAQFSELEQIMSIRSDIESYHTTDSTTPGTTGTGSSTGSSTSGSGTSSGTSGTGTSGATGTSTSNNV